MGHRFWVPLHHRGQRSVIGAGLGLLLGAPAFAGAVAPFPSGAEGGHAARRRRRFRGRAARGGLQDFLQVGVRARVLLWGVSSPPLSPSALMTSCAASSVGDRGRVLRGAAGSAIVVSLCLRAGGVVRISRGRCTCSGPGGAWVGELVRWFRGPCVRVVIRCSSPAVRGDPLARGVRARALSFLRLSSSWGLLGPNVHVLWARVCRHALWGLRAAGVVEGRLRGGWPATVVRGVWCQALSLPWSPALWGGQPGYRNPYAPGAVGACVGTRHPNRVRPRALALRAVTVAEGRPRGGCLLPL